MLRVIILSFLVLVIGCASTGTTMKPPGRYAIGQSYSIQTSKSWSHIPGPPESWTVDGMSLGVLHTWADLEDGDTLFQTTGRKMPPFRSDMSELEIAEIVSDTVETLVSGADVETTKFQPTAFGSNDGFRFEVQFIQDGLRNRGLAVGTIRDGKLDLIFFKAPAEHYFEYYAPEIESIIASVMTTA